MDHDGFVLLGNGVERFLDHMASKGIHTQAQSVPANGIGDCHDLFWRAVLEAALDQEVPKTVDHQRVGLRNDGFDDLILLLHCTHFEFLLKEDRGLLVIVAYNLVYNVFPIARDAPVEESPVI